MPVTPEPAFDVVVERLIEALAGPLPGVDGQVLLSPRPRRGWVPGHVPDDARRGAGLLLIYPRGRAAHVVLTLRGSQLPKHAGQVSLPGGAVEDHESLVEGALRETHEEVAVEPGVVRVLGQLTPLHIPVSGFALHPFVGVAAETPRFRAEAGEVERILEPELRHLVDPQTISVVRREHKGVEYEVPVLNVDGERVWGATAMILAEFLTLLGYRADPWNERGD